MVDVAYCQAHEHRFQSHKAWVLLIFLKAGGFIAVLKAVLTAVPPAACLADFFGHTLLENVSAGLHAMTTLALKVLSDCLGKS